MPPTRLIPSCLALLLLACGAPAGGRSLRIEIANHPPRCDAELTFGVGGLIAGCNPHFDDDGCAVGPGSGEVTIDLEQTARFHEIEVDADDRLKVMIHCAGFRIATWETEVGKLKAGETWRPRLEELPRKTIHGVAQTTDGQPLAETPLEIQYSLLEQMTYFEFTDGMVTPLRLGEVTTARDGSFAVEVPDLTLDPFIDADRGVRLVQIGPPHDADAGVLPLSLKLPELYVPGRVFQFERLAEAR
ncbi:MAG: hypothetical protein GY719_42240 [bacterium]|nr:hypothetical protein [bacterium]